MKREDLKEFHFITSITNVVSIVTHGILSHRRAKQVAHKSVASQTIQDRRAKVVVPGGRPLHEYANLYFDARNPMMYVINGRHRELCVLRVNTDVLDVDGVVVTPVNASGDYVRWGAGADGVRHVDREATFADDWTHSDRIEYYRRKAARCAEVLVPDRVAPSHILGAYVSCNEARDAFDALGTTLAATINSRLFFR